MSLQPQENREVIQACRSLLRRPSVYLYLIAAAGVVWGQTLFFSDQLGAGLLATLLSLIPLGLALLGDARLQKLQAEAAALGERFNRSLQAVRQAGEKAADAAPAQAGSARPESAPAAAEPRSAGSKWGAWREACLRNIAEPLAGVRVTLPKSLILGAALLLVLAAQPFLFLEAFLPAALLLAPGLLLLVVFFTNREERIDFGTLDVWAKTAFMGLPGTVLIVIGAVILNKYVQLDWRHELVGIACTIAGTLLLFGLLPKVLDDPEAEGGDYLDDHSGRARTTTGVIVKIVLAAAGGFCLFLCRGLAARSLTQAVVTAMIGLALLACSFPWSLQTAGAPAQAKTGSVSDGIKLLLRLLAFGAALYLGYHGQLLISREQLYPGLMRFLFAGILLVTAFREPTRGREDPLRERPLKWYWEAAGLILVLGVAVWLRTHLLDQIPYGIECDEAGGVINAREVFRGKLQSIVAHPVGQPVFYLVQLHLEHMLLGLGNWGIKLHALVYGILDIFLIFLFSRLYFGPRVALGTAALLSLTRWHIHFSRFGYANTMLIFFVMMGFYFIVKGLYTRRKWYFLLAGMALSFSLTTEVAARLVPVMCLGIMGYLAFNQRHFFRRNWKPILAILLGAWMAGGAIYLLYARSSTALFGRAKSVSIFSNDPNAPRDLAAGVLGSIKGSLTMLNWHGDTRTRHNGGMSGEPMLDFWSAILFALGFAYSLYHWRRLRYFILLIWFFGFMSASVFSIEAPQAHRAFGILPAVILLASVFLDRSRRLLREALGRPGALAGGAAFLLLLVPIGRTNAHKYFDTLPAFDSNCCDHARYLGSLGPNWENFIMTAYLWQGHPPFMVWAQDVSGRFFYTAADVVPMYVDTKKDVCYSFVFEYPPLLPTIQCFYPKGEFHEVRHPKYGLMFQAWNVKNQDIMATRGLTATYRSAAGGPAVTRKDESLNLVFDRGTWPLPGAGAVEWEGTLLIPHRGQYTFYLDGTDAEVTFGRGRTLRSSGNRQDRMTVELAGGLHRLRARARQATPNGRIAFSWSCPDESVYPLYKDAHARPFEREPVPATRFYTYPEPKGLLETFYPSANWTGEPVYQQVQPALMFNFMSSPYGLSLPLSADWRGWITAERDGEYQFSLEAPGYGEVVIDDRMVVKSGATPKGYVPGGDAKNPVFLTAGRHRIRVRWSVGFGMSLRLWWTPPGGTRALVPADVLAPAEE